VEDLLLSTALSSHLAGHDSDTPPTIEQFGQLMLDEPFRNLLMEMKKTIAELGLTEAVSLDAGTPAVAAELTLTTVPLTSTFRVHRRSLRAGGWQPRQEDAGDPAQLQGRTLTPCIPLGRHPICPLFPSSSSACALVPPGLTSKESLSWPSDQREIIA
jgi:hypothetical protein